MNSFNLKRIIISQLFLFCMSTVFSQTLNLPSRSSSLPNGDDFIDIVRNLSLQAREDSIYSHVVRGNVPNFQRNLVPVSRTKTIGQTTYNVTYYVLPDYLAIGHDTNYFLCPTTPGLAQKIAYFTGTTLPTSEMVDEIYNSAPLKLYPSTQSPGPQMTTVAYFEQHNNTVRNTRQNNIGAHPLGTLVGGDKKDVIISNEIYENGNEYVVIYGWHTSVGNPIQPVYNGHAIDYVDYSHGIRLVQNKAYINGDSVLITDALQNSSLQDLFSREGTIGTPVYPVSGTNLSKISSFAVVREDATSIRVICNVNPGENVKVQLSSDGVNFWNEVYLNLSNPVISNLTTNQIQYVRLVREFYGALSQSSEVLAALPSVTNSEFVIVNGFDRASTGNTYNFVIQHGTSIQNNGYGFSSATNEAIKDSLILLSSYSAVDYILGEESSQDDCFDSEEQAILKSYLESGGYLFVSGSEIGWDLEHLGSADDIFFYQNYLKADYIEDAPNNTSNSFYTVIPTNTGLFSSMASVGFDNGTNGTYNVDWPDVISPINGSIGDLYYSGYSAKYAGVSYEGTFGASSSIGKVVYHSFPFETVYNTTDRDLLMGEIGNFFFASMTTSIDEEQETQLKVYPNPSSGIVYVEGYHIGERLRVMDLSGKEVYQSILNTSRSVVDLSSFQSGVYLLKMGNITQRVVKQ